MRVVIDDADRTESVSSEKVCPDQFDQLLFPGKCCNLKQNEAFCRIRKQRGLIAHDYHHREKLIKAIWTSSK